MVTTTCLVTLAPISMATREAVSKSMTSLMEAITPSPISFLTISLACTLRVRASSPTVISSGRATSSRWRR